MERQALLDRRAVLEQEREIRKAQAVLQQRQVDDRIDAIMGELEKARAARADLEESAARDDYAYLHLIAEIERWLQPEEPLPLEKQRPVQSQGRGRRARRQ